MWLTWAVHWLQPKLLLLNVKAEHVLLVVIGMARGFPQIKVVDIGRHHLLILVLPIHFPYELRHRKNEC